MHKKVTINALNDNLSLNQLHLECVQALYTIENTCDSRFYKLKLQILAFLATFF